jgi:hypothetical protein
MEPPGPAQGLPEMGHAKVEGAGLESNCTVLYTDWPVLHFDCFEYYILLSIYLYVYFFLFPFIYFFALEIELRASHSTT